MKLVRMKTKNMRSLKDSEWNFSKNMALIGPNGSGKSSFLDAIGYAVNGTVLKNAVRRGSDELCVSLTADDGNQTTITRLCYTDEVFAINGVEVGKTDFLLKAEELKEAFSGECSVIPAASNPVFLRESRDSLWEFLQKGSCTGLRLAGSKELGITLPDGSTLYRTVPNASRVEVNGRKTTAKSADEVIRNISGAYPGAFRIALNSEMVRGMESKDIGRWLLSILPVRVTSEKACCLAGLSDEEKEEVLTYLPKEPDPVSVDDIESLTKKIRSLRTEVNTRLKDTQRLAVFDGMLPVMDVAAASREMDLASEKEAEYEAYARAENTVRAVLAEEEKKKEYLLQMKKKLSDLPEGRQVPEEEIIRTKELVQEYEMSILTSERLLAMIEESIRNLLETIAKLDTDACPLCDSLVCRTDKSMLKKELKGRKEAFLSQKEDAAKQISDLQKKKAEASARLQKLTQELDAWKKRSTLSESIRQMEEMTPFRIPEIKKPSLSRGEIDLLKKKASRHMEEAIGFERAMQAEILLNELKEKSLYYTRLLGKCDPKSGDLMKAILGYILDPVQKKMNETASVIFKDLQVAFETGPEGLRIYMKPHDRNAYIAMENLSRGERTLLSFLLMDILSQLSGSRMIAFDNIEALDGEALDHLLEVTEKKEMQDRYDHIFLCAVDHDSILSILSKHPQYELMRVG